MMGELNKKVQTTRQGSDEVNKNSRVNTRSATQQSAKVASAGKGKSPASPAKKKSPGEPADAAAAKQQALDQAALEKRARKDAKERKKAIKALRLSDSKARKLLDMIDIGVAFHDLVRNEDGLAVDYRVREVNSAFEAVMELSADDIAGNPASSVYGKRGQAPFIKDIVESMQAGEARAFEGRVKSTQGRLRFSVQPMDKNLFALLVEDASQEAKARRRLAFLGTRLKNLSSEHSEVTAALKEARAEVREMQGSIKALQKDLDASAKESASLAAALQRESAKTQRLEATVDVATQVRDNLKELTSNLSRGLRAK